jgi:predicted nucleotidyltransferase component of viral defense system
MRVLTEIQIEFIRRLAKSSIQDRFFLTGGTALSEFYLKHRLSEDLDFFTGEERNVIDVLPVVEVINRELSGKLEIKRSARSIIQFLITRGEEMLHCDFAYDSPFRLKPTVLNPEFGIFIDNELDIACNKLSALYDRNNPKDFVDIFFIDREIIAFDQLLIEALKKHIGLENYWLAQALIKVEDFRVFPKMIRPLDIEEFKEFFRQKAEWLMTISDNPNE